jgi:hypothetical protein
MKEDEKGTRVRGVKKVLKEKADHLSVKWKKASEEDAKGVFLPPFMLVMS